MFLEFTAMGDFTLADVAQETNKSDRFRMSSSVEPGDGTDTICGSKLGSDRARFSRKVVLLIWFMAGAFRAAEGFAGGGAIPANSTSK
jgi:hypothetical protein